MNDGADFSSGRGPWSSLKRCAFSVPARKIGCARSVVLVKAVRVLRAPLLLLFRGGAGVLQGGLLDGFLLRLGAVVAFAPLRGGNELASCAAPGAGKTAPVARLIDFMRIPLKTTQNHRRG